MTPTFETILLEPLVSTQAPERLWKLTVHCPQALNALNQNVLQEIQKALVYLENLKPACLGLILTGAGEKAFVAGADIKEMPQMTPSNASDFARAGQKVFAHLESSKIPVIAAVNGFALGGGFELALACDFIIASENAKFALPEVSLGLIPGFGGTVRLARAAGLPLAKQMVLSGEMMSATDAERKNIVAKVVPLTDLMSTCLKQLEVMASRSPLAVSAAKKALHKNWDSNSEAAMEFEAASFAGLFQHEDAREGTQAFLDKRKPHFKGE